MTIYSINGEEKAFVEHLNILYIAFNGEKMSLPRAYHSVRTPRTQLKNVVMLSPLVGRQLALKALFFSAMASERKYTNIKNVIDFRGPHFGLKMLKKRDSSFLFIRKFCARLS